MFHHEKPLRSEDLSQINFYLSEVKSMKKPWNWIQFLLHYEVWCVLIGCRVHHSNSALSMALYSFSIYIDEKSRRLKSSQKISMIKVGTAWSTGIIFTKLYQMNVCKNTSRCFFEIDASLPGRWENAILLISTELMNVRNLERRPKSKKSLYYILSFCMPYYSTLTNVV